MSDVSRRNFLRTAAGAIAGVVGAGIAASAAKAANHLSNEEIIRAWKDESFRNTLTPEQLAQMPQHPAGKVEIEYQSLNETLRSSLSNPRSRPRRCCEASRDRFCH